ncbi:hypothetical protein FSP39_011810 [Pinctada imbricata]|uniref:Elongator complex protein 2 n=1 Tax=Pinctada imbricata TaxID=66713 RepID=A0AA89CAS5_PINIB|nr:hypothetical protein FSP39_011810 [Pinctada imbricata]
MAVRTCYISSGCNRTPHCADWNEEGLLCYGSSHCIVLFEPDGYANGTARVTDTLNKHTDRVNCVRWMRGDYVRERPCFVSGSVDKTAVVWQKENNKYQPVAVLSGHTGPINALDAYSLSSDITTETDKEKRLTVSYVVTASSDSSLNIWMQKNDQEYSLKQTLTFGTGFVLDVAITVFPSINVPLIACGCDDHKVHLFVLNEGQEFKKVMTLQGHEDWVRAVDFTVDDKGDILLASAGQDYFIRIWRLSWRQPGSDVIQEVKKMSIDEEIKMKENTFSFTHLESSVTYAVSLESVLSGHENWIYGLQWHPPQKTNGQTHRPMCILSASMDKTMILWKPDPESGVWVEQVRVGEVGGNTLGLYGGLFGPDGNSIMAHGYQGAFHQWTYSMDQDIWQHKVTVSGHFDAVQDLEWDKDNGQFVVSVSSDQTTRLHAPWVRQGEETRWYEIARPQVHGYDLQCMAAINRYKFASGADEKVTRIFEAPSNFIENFCSICGANLKEEKKKESAQNRPEGASVPALGLSNKAIFSGEVQSQTGDRELQPHPNDQYPEVYFTPLTLTAPPSEEQLLQNTLWPETQKLYGHGYEIFSLACDPDGKILASACKAAKAEFASVILWDTTNWTQICSLSSHSLTVTQMAFSHSGQYLLTVSRDRTWALYRRRQDDQPESDPIFSRISYTDKKTSVHSRIIWSCAWSGCDSYFFTASRDKKLIVWRRPDVEDTAGVISPKACSTLDVADAATAVDVAPFTVKGDKHLVAVGLECGSICLYSWKAGGDNSNWQSICTITAHHMAVKRLRFSPCLGLAGQKNNANEHYQQLASCSLDHSVRIFDIDTTNI